MSLSEILQRLRKERGLSQEDVARKLFVSRQSVSKWENGAAEPGVDNLKALAKLYGVTVDELVGNESGRTAATAPLAQPVQPPVPPERPPAARGMSAGDRFYWVIVLVNLAVSVVAWGWMDHITIPLFLIALVIGIWAVNPNMWIACMVCVGISVASNLWSNLGDAFRYGEAAVFLAMELALAAFDFFALSRPSIRARFDR